MYQARTKGLLWKTKALERKKATMLSLSGPLDNFNKTIIDGAAVRYVHVHVYIHM